MDGHDRVELAGQRTDLAEDRTMLANERTFAGWMRTGLAAVGIGVGFNALFEEMQPSWLPRAIASCFVLAGMVVFFLAERHSCIVLERLDAHSVRPVRRMNLRLVVGMMSLGSFVLLVSLWFLV
ncbi:YidH family protein [Pelagerythrobacter sp.]|uniref:YidH family protein n=1 Tax=Pelagerythrobacter sp. TaxID=2800702 RepID=UPI0035B0926F